MFTVIDPKTVQRQANIIQLTVKVDGHQRHISPDAKWADLRLDSIVFFILDISRRKGPERILAGCHSVTFERFEIFHGFHGNHSILSKIDHTTEKPSQPKW